MPARGEGIPRAAHTSAGWRTTNGVPMTEEPPPHRRSTWPGDAPPQVARRFGPAPAGPAARCCQRRSSPG
eukprot:8589825-Pyramimonas_sp.AAC.1